MAWKSCFRCNVRANPVSGGMTGWGATRGGKVGHSDHRGLKPGRACLEDERIPAGQAVGVCVSVGVNFDEAGLLSLVPGLVELERVWRDKDRAWGDGRLGASLSLRPSRYESIRNGQGKRDRMSSMIKSDTGKELSETRTNQTETEGLPVD